MLSEHFTCKGCGLGQSVSIVPSFSYVIRGLGDELVFPQSVDNFSSLHKSWEMLYKISAPRRDLDEGHM